MGQDVAKKYQESPWWNTPEGEEAKKMLRRDQEEEYKLEARMWRKRQLLGIDEEEE